MSEIILPENYYQQRINQLTNALSLLKKRKTQLGWLRLLIVFSGAAILYFLWPATLGTSVLVIFFTLVVFLIVLQKDFINRDAIIHHEKLIEINQQEILYLQHRFAHQKDGAEFIQEDLSYAGDLDIFGRSSVYQMINRTTSQQGNQLLAHWLMHAADAGEIHRKTKCCEGTKRKYKMATGTSGLWQYFRH